jgi:hypothetical protein
MAMMSGARHRNRRITLAADPAYDTKDFVSEMRGMNLTPQSRGTPSARAGVRAMEAPRGMEAIQVVSGNGSESKRIEEVFGWIKTIGTPRRSRHADWNSKWVAFTATAYNLVRMRKLMSPAVQSV